MLISHVHLNVHPRFVEAFKQATLENASESKKENGIARFDVLQSKDEPTSFVLVEAYYSADDQVKHKETAHYKKWANTVKEFIDGPRNVYLYTNIFPKDADWAQLKHTK